MKEAHSKHPLSLRMEDLLAARGANVSHQTVRLWAEKFGRHFANDIRKRSAGRLGDKWHLDEVVSSPSPVRNTVSGVRLTRKWDDTRALQRRQRPLTGIKLTLIANLELPS